MRQQHRAAILSKALEHSIQMILLIITAIDSPEEEAISPALDEMDIIDEIYDPTRLENPAHAFHPPAMVVIAQDTQNHRPWRELPQAFNEVIGKWLWVAAHEISREDDYIRVELIDKLNRLSHSGSLDPGTIMDIRQLHDT
jgi:hypothetical protein